MPTRKVTATGHFPAGKLVGGRLRWPDWQCSVAAGTAPEHGPTQYVPGSHYSGRPPGSLENPEFEGQGPKSIYCRAGDIYFSRPLTPRGYLLGKGAVAAFFAFLTLWIPLGIFYGYATKSGSLQRVFLLQGEQIHIHRKGDLIENRTGVCFENLGVDLLTAMRRQTMHHKCLRFRQFHNRFVDPIRSQFRLPARRHKPETRIAQSVPVLH